MENKKYNIKKGDKVCIAIIKGSNASRFIDLSLENIDNWTKEVIVTTVNKKYITVDYGKMKFEVENNYLEKVTCGGSDYKLYLNKEEVYNETKRENILCDLFGYGFDRKEKLNKLTLEQLERINKIVEENL